MELAQRVQKLLLSKGLKAQSTRPHECASQVWKTVVPKAACVLGPELGWVCFLEIALLKAFSPTSIGLLLCRRERLECEMSQVWPCMTLILAHTRQTRWPLWIPGQPNLQCQPGLCGKAFFLPMLIMYFIHFKKVNNYSTPFSSF